ncbi:MAG: hypothetical protein ACKV2V_15475 [Blastocatellia bacterium]
MVPVVMEALIITAIISRRNINTATDEIIRSSISRTDNSIASDEKEYMATLHWFSSSFHKPIRERIPGRIARDGIFYDRGLWRSGKERPGRRKR